MELEGCVLPDGLLYDLELEVWLSREPEPGLVRIGVMAPFSAFAGKVTSFRFRPEEPTLRRGASLGTIESLRLTAPLRTPVAGAVVERNARLPSRPKLLNDEPYTGGWVARIRAESAALPSTLRPVEEVLEQVRAQIAERRVHCYPAVPDVELYEIGSECSAVLARVDDEIARREVHDVLLLVADDPTAALELERWRMRTGHTVLGRWKEEHLYRFLIRKEDEGHRGPASAGAQG